MLKGKSCAKRRVKSFFLIIYDYFLQAFWNVCIVTLNLKLIGKLRFWILIFMMYNLFKNCLFEPDKKFLMKKKIINCLGMDFRSNSTFSKVKTLDQKYFYLLRHYPEWLVVLGDKKRTEGWIAARLVEVSSGYVY